MSKRLSYYKKEFWIDKGLSEKEAILKISEIKKKQKENRKPRFTVLQKEFWIDKGLSEKEAILKISGIQRKNSGKLTLKNRFNPRLKECWVKRGLSEKESEEKVKETFKKGSNMCQEYWVKRGYSIKEAEEEIKKVQQKNSKKRKDYKKEDQNTNIEFYIKRKFPNAIEALRDRQNTRSLQKYIEKYGEIEGIVKYNKSIEKFKNSSWYSKSREEQIELTLKRTKFSNFYSKSSILFFESLIKDLNILFKIRWKNNEHFIRHDKGIVFYDFCMPDLNFIIEFNGIKFHPNKHKLSSIEFDNWKQLLSNKTAQEIYEKDLFKINLAKKHNFDIFIVWEDDNLETKIKELRNELINRINQKSNN